MGRFYPRRGTAFALSLGMSKQNNVNPNFYYEGDRNHQGEGIVHEEHKSKMNEEKRKHSQGNPGESNFIPGEAPVGEKTDK